MLPGNGKRGVGAAAVAAIVVAVIIATSGVYYFATTMGPHSLTGSFSETSTEQTFTSTGPEISTTSTAANSTSSTTSSSTFSNTTSSEATETSQSSSSASPMKIGMVVNTTIVDQAQAYDECGTSVGCSKTIYIFNMTVTNLGTQDFSFNELNLGLRTNGSNLYAIDYVVYAITTPANGRPHGLQSSDIQPGTKISGEEGFEIPANEVPSELVYQDEFAGVNATASIPSPTSWVSEVVTFGAVSIAPQDLACGGVGNDQQPMCFTATYEGMNSSILGSADYFTGEVMAFRITITLGSGNGEPGTVPVTSSVGGFFVKGITAPECTGGSGTCTNWIVDAYLVLQPGVSYFGTPGLTLMLNPA